MSAAATVEELIKCVGCKKKFTNAGYAINRHGARLKSCIECQARRKVVKRIHTKCDHGIRPSKCALCDGRELCNHFVYRYRCASCTPLGHLRECARTAITRAVASDRAQTIEEYLGCDMTTYREYLSGLFKDGMTWTNYGAVWQIDHITPLGYRLDGIAPTNEQKIARLHYTNTQPLTVQENQTKHNRFIG